MLFMIMSTGMQHSHPCIKSQVIMVHEFQHASLNRARMYKQLDYFSSEYNYTHVHGAVQSVGAPLAAWRTSLCDPRLWRALSLLRYAHVSSEHSLKLVTCRVTWHAYPGPRPQSWMRGQQSSQAQTSLGCHTAGTVTIGSVHNLWRDSIVTEGPHHLSGWPSYSTLGGCEWKRKLKGNDNIKA